MSVKIRSARPASHDHTEADQISVKGIAAGYVSTATIATDAVTAPKIAAGQVMASTIGAAVVSETHIKDDAISAAKIGAGQVMASTIAATVISGTHIKDDAISAGKIAAGQVMASTIAAAVVGLTHATGPVKRSLYIGDETEVSVSTATYTTKKDFAFYKSASYLNIKWLRFITRMKASGAAATKAMACVYIDGGTTALASFATSSTTYVMLTDDFNASNITAGRHTIEFKMKCSAAGNRAYNEMFEMVAEQV